MSNVRVIEDHWPAVIIAVRPGVVTDDDIHETNRRFLEILERRKGTFVAINDLRQGGQLNAHQRKLLADFQNAHADLLSRHCAGAAMVFDSALMRGMLTAVLWLTRPKWETRIYKTLDEALAWARIRAAEHEKLKGVRPPIDK